MADSERRRLTSAGGRDSQAGSQPRASLSGSIHKVHHQEGSVFGVTLNTLCNVMGGGVLSLPFAMYNGSVVIAFALLLFCAAVSAFSVLTLIYACDVTQKYSYTEALAFTLFPDQPLTANLSHAEEIDEDEGIYDPENETPAHRHRRHITMAMEVVVFLNSFAALVIYSRVIADSIPKVLKNFMNAHGVWVEEWFWLVIPAVIFFILSCARSMDELKWISLMGFLTIFYIVVIVMIRYFTNLENAITEEAGVNKVSWFHINMSCFLTLPAYALAFGYHFNVPYFYKELADRRPKVFMRTVFAAFPIITVSYGCTGLLGYLTFGALVASEKAGGDIVNNFNTNDIAVNIGRLGLFGHFVSVYPILSISARRGMHRFLCLLFEKPELLDEDGNPVLRSRFDAPPGDPSTTTMRSIVLEALFIVLSATVTGAFAPGIGDVVELAGSLFGIPLMLVFPGLIGLRIFLPEIPLVGHLPLKLCRVLSWVNTIGGMLFLVFSIVAFVYEHSKK